jgi:uncharacterized delta-60 repeat protein
MQENRLTKTSHPLSVSIRLGLSLALGTVAVLLLSGLMSLASPSLAPGGPRGAGALDITFGTGGVVTTAIGPGNDVTLDLAIQEDGKIVAAGYASNGSDYDIALARYTTSGALDTAFGSTGVVTTAIGPGEDWAYDVAIQENGRIVAAGFSHSGSDWDIALVRYSTSGALDTSFGTSGVVTTSIGPGDDYAQAVAIQEDGRIVAAGHAHSGSDDDFAVVRYTTSGALDTTFGNSGVVTTPIGPSHDRAYDVAIQEDGRIVAAGFAHSGSDWDIALVRYTVSGTLDTTFGSTGVVTTSIGPGDDYGRAVAIQDDGRIVAAGYASNGSDYDFTLVRYTTSGALDTTFGSTGVVTTPTGPGSGRAYDVAIQEDGGIVAAGEAWNGSDSDIAVVRYTLSGALDTTFGNGGVVTTPIGSGSNRAFGVAIQQDRKIVAAGLAWNGSDWDIALVRYHAAWRVYLPLVLRDS